jgi:hypothetical protein
LRPPRHRPTDDGINILLFRRRNWYGVGHSYLSISVRKEVIRRISILTALQRNCYVAVVVAVDVPLNNLPLVYRTAIAAASSYHWNPHNLEAPWYGLWNRVLLDLVDGLHDMIVTPQYGIALRRTRRR